MFSYEEYYKLYNCPAEAEYLQNKERLFDMMKCMTLTKEKGFREKVFWFLKAQGEFLQRLCLLEEKFGEEYYKSASLQEMKKDQQWLYGDILPGAYKKCYANPLYCVSVFGKELGPVLAAVAAYFRQGIADAYTHRRFMLGARVKLYFALSAAMTRGQVRAEGISNLLAKQYKENVAWDTGLWFHRNYGIAEDALLEVIETQDLNQVYYLYSLGRYVAEEDIRLQKFMATLPEEKIETMARSYVNGFRDGFARDNKDIRKKSTVAIVYPLGMERMIRRAAQIFREELNMEPYILNITGTSPNKQYEYDHRFDLAVCMDEEYVEARIAEAQKVICNNIELVRSCGGRTRVETFGEEPFSPITENHALSFTAEQNALYARLNGGITEILYGEGQLGDSSFTIIAFPVHAIGEDFEEIFDKVIEINSMDQTRYGKAQQALINALDKGHEVFIKGSGDNETALTIALQPLENPKKQTNFYNCLADVNIPLGEVFTSPQLKGTNGVLHVEEIFLWDLKYENLKLWFTDGYVTDYSCTNFENLEEGKRYIYENLLLPHDSLPMGEFAIGTNTEAYCMAKKYDIMEKLPILIIEKMGPHFAIGDTCYSNDEDRPVYNSDKKEIMSRDNERSILRKEDSSEAYTHKHTDVTLPYESIGRISVMTDHGQIDLIREGRFVLLGTDILNAPMIRMEQEALRQEEKKAVEQD